MSESRPLGWLAAACAVFGLAGCATLPRAAPPEAAPKKPPLALRASEPMALPSLAGPDVAALLRGAPVGEAWRGIGRITGRVPGTGQEVSGVRVARHRVHVAIDGGFARTEVEEELANDSYRVLEGRLEFPVPPNASVSRLSLLVGTRWMEAAMVERSTAASVFGSIVDDSVRPRDPALLEQNRPSTLSLRVFPIPAHGIRRVKLAYDQPLARGAHGLRYVYPLSAGNERSLILDRFSIDVTIRHAPAEVTASWPDASVSKEKDAVSVRASSARLLPLRDFVIDYPADRSGAIAVTLAPAKARNAALFALRVPVELAERSAKTPPSRRVIVIDKSASQTDASLDDARRLALAVLRAVPAQRFALLACDAACTAFPESGLATASQAELEDAKVWLAALEPSGASDVAGALLDAAKRAGSSAQIVYLGDGRPTAGELRIDAVGDRVSHAFFGQNLDLRLVAAGPDADPALDALAALTHATVHQPDDGVVEALDSATLRAPRLELDGDTSEVYPKTIANQRIGGELLVMGRVGAHRPSRVTLLGEIGGKTVRIRRDLVWPERAQADASVLGHLHAGLELAELERSGAGLEEIERVSLANKVMSRQTSLIALENDAMYRQYGLRGTPRMIHARLRGTHHTRPPQVRMAMTMVSGRTPPETIRLVLRQNAGRFRGCYHRGLLKNPKLAGRVVLQFVIKRDGHVETSVDAGSDLPDHDVINCMLEKVRELAFSEPEGGVINVVYPLMLSPNDQPETLTLDHGPESRDYINVDTPVAARVQVGNDDWIDDTDSSPSEVIAETAHARGDSRELQEVVRGYLSRGQFDAAHLSATLAVQDVANAPSAFDLLFDAAAATGDRRRQLAAAAARVEREPENAEVQETAAKVFELANEPVRACAHWRAAASLPYPSDRALQAAARCKGEEVAPGRPRSDARLTAKIQCAKGAKRCPSLIVIASNGTVYTDSVSGKRGTVRVDDLFAQAYRILPVGNGRGSVSVTLDGEAHRFEIDPDGPRTLAIVTP